MPSKRQVRYLEAWLDPTQPKTIIAISKAIEVPRRTVQSWLAHEPFKNWFMAEVARATEHLVEPVLHKVAHLALLGSIEHAKLLMIVTGRVKTEVGSGPQGGVTVVIGVPRAGDPVPAIDVTPHPQLAPAMSLDEH